MAGHYLRSVNITTLTSAFHIMKAAPSCTCLLSTSSRLREAGIGYAGGEYQPLPITTSIGKREVVGFGMNGEESYIDDIHAPFPAIRFKEDTPEILKLKEKEKGDWKKLTMAEKKELYRASFCQTFSERMAPTGEWKVVLTITITGIAISAWIYMAIFKYVYGPLPETLTNEEFQRKQIQRMIDLRVGAIDGFASDYDYDKGEWKK